ncbi:MAG: tRNA dihydrouridine(20/20a) synthase DusA [Chromatiales bacterium]|nr:tRNA dihydrouridine(20/20a) synthase DusA [Gammaproteobacteria bacterium]MCP5351798.1 tRNA dihydrouridine(20/20a) synthase DusA [Chromatiales bacterium]
MDGRIDRRFSVAPMLDWTDRHCRYFLRLLSRHTLLYTEMITTGALLHGDVERHLRHDASEHPLAVQLGGSEPDELARCARLAEEWGYDEVNLNVGCPSDRVQSGAFGACLMAEPSLVADGVKAMRDAVSIPVTVKHRIGIDARDSYPELVDFVGTVAEAGCDVFIVHARKAWLSGLSPKENREVPPLRYEVVAKLKRDFPGRHFILNGGIQTLDAAERHLQTFDGVMLGRAAYHDPYLLAEVDRRVFDDPHPIPTREQIVEAFIPYVETQLAAGLRLNHLTRHILGLFQNIPGARHWRRHLSEHAHRPDAGIDTLRAALPG